MFDLGFYEFTMRRAYSKRLRESEASRLARQAEAGPRRRARFLLWARRWSVCHLPMLPSRWQAHIDSTGQGATADASKTGSGLIL